MSATTNPRPRPTVPYLTYEPGNPRLVRQVRHEYVEPLWLDDDFETDED